MNKMDYIIICKTKHCERRFKNYFYKPVNEKHQWIIYLIKIGVVKEDIIHAL